VVEFPQYRTFRSEDLLQLLKNRKTLQFHISSQNLVAVLEDLFDDDRSDEWNNLMEVLMVSTAISILSYCSITWFI